MDFCSTNTIMARVIAQINDDTDKVIREAIPIYAKEQKTDITAYFIEADKADIIIRLGIEEYIKRYPGQEPGIKYTVWGSK